MGARRESREKALEMLYTIELRNVNTMEEVEEIFSAYWRCSGTGTSEEIQGFATSLVRGVMINLGHLDHILAHKVQNWKIDRIAKVDKNIIRLALYEIFFVENIPWQVTINEAIDIAKKYGSADSDRFVNGILDSVVKQSEGSVL